MKSRDDCTPVLLLGVLPWGKQGVENVAGSIEPRGSVSVEIPLDRASSAAGLRSHPHRRIRPWFNQILSSSGRISSGVLRVEGLQAFGSRVRHTTLGDQASDKAGGHHVEGCVRGGAAPRCHLDCGDGAVLAQAGNLGDFPFVSFLLKKIGARFARVNKSIPERNTRS